MCCYAAVSRLIKIQSVKDLTWLNWKKSFAFKNVCITNSVCIMAYKDVTINGTCDRFLRWQERTVINHDSLFKYKPYNRLLISLVHFLQFNRARRKGSLSRKILITKIITLCWIFVGKPVSDINLSHIPSRTGSAACRTLCVYLYLQAHQQDGELWDGEMDCLVHLSVYHTGGPRRAAHTYGPFTVT